MKIFQTLMILLLLMSFVVGDVNAFEHDQLHQIIESDPVLQGSFISISVRSAQTGEVLFEHNANTRLRPASNMKLLTAATALSVLGEEHRFTTELYSDGVLNWKVLNGDLIIKGSGDPTLMVEDLRNLVQVLKTQGVKVIRGDVIADDTHFDDVRYPIDVPWSDEETYYGAQISALTVSPDQDYHTGTIRIMMKPGKQTGDKALISIVPQTNYVTIVNEVRTTSRDNKGAISVSRKHGENVIYLKGSIPMNGTTKTEYVAVWEPTEHVLEVIKQVLTNHGIILLGSTKVGKTPERAKQVAVHQSMPLSEILVPFMKYSNNGHAEMIVKEMGYKVTGEGSFESGLSVLKNELQRFDLEGENLIIRDGSGISHVNSITANDISKLLFKVQEEPWFSSFYHSLPLVDGDTRIERGTLYSRMKQTAATKRVRAKTGTLTSVSSLAGYIERNDENDLIFSILLNNVLDVKQAKKLEDRIVLSLTNK
ncbi:D-alanyl-D-alanine carboxypeptidase/D-alanyl-D-alanine endopeptidase [Halalkalibacter krulwichiae]|uniref:D-alanyl-D-alanine carboxypeptidase DacC n=1 Tax=Halalkalibacter krulwichiae TaxID=199441 RepID=A0A1X9MIM7_9BACI|nr:D-alanyl-D-alanine carboxypeptidase/D-alanyl-D-alanine-endopeptidase [Halalkalibacter krulwichiae]ARK30462.1 D-alanyl-D-alanine carboxypeptidase DacC precursor [Halalkalibacter krulwichiae]